MIWASPALPSAVHDLTTARTLSIIDGLSSANVMTFADKGYPAAGGSVRTPFKRPRHRPRAVPTPESRQPRPRPHPRPRRTRRRHPQDLESLVNLRCRPRRATATVQAILALHHIEAHRPHDEKGSIRGMSYRRLRSRWASAPLVLQVHENRTSPPAPGAIRRGAGHWGPTARLNASPFGYDKTPARNHVAAYYGPV